MSDTSSRLFVGIPTLTNKTVFPEWVQRLKLSIGAAKKRSFILPTAVPPPLSSTPTSAEVHRRDTWLDDDYQLASLILQTCSKAIITATEPLLDNPLVIAKSHAVYSHLVDKYGTSGTQYKHTLLRKFMDSQCGDDEDVGEWVNGVKAEMAELKTLGVDLETLCVTVLLHGLPSRFTNLVDIVWTQTAPPTPDSVADQISTIDAGQKSRNLQSSLGTNHSSSSAFAAQLQSLGISENDVYALAARAGKKASAEHPCHRCGSPDHWANKCPQSPSGHSNGSPTVKSSGKPSSAAAMVSAAEPMSADRAYALVQPGITSFSDEVDVAF